MQRRRSNECPTGHLRWRVRMSVAVIGMMVGIGIIGAGVAFGFWLTTDSSNPAQAVAASLSAPAAPTATATSGSSVTLNWTLPVGQLTGAHYVVTRSSGPGSPTTVCTVASTVSSCSDTALTSGTGYGYSIDAVLDSWQSPAVATSVVTLGVTTSSLPSATVGLPYSVTLAAAGGSGTYTHWSLSSGSLPSWASLNTSTGVVSGTPTTAGTTGGLQFTVTDSNGATSGSGSLSIAVGRDTTTTSVTASPATVTYGAESASSFTAKVTASHGESVPNGESVTVVVGAVSCTASTSGGTGTGSCVIGNVGLPASAVAYSVTVSYSGDSNLTGSTATAATGVTVNKDTTTTTVSETSTRVTYGAESASTFTAKVTATHGESVPNGEQVTITVGSTSCVATTAGGTGSGTCTIANTALPASATAYAVSATYGGDANLSGSTISATTGLAVAQDTATVSAFTVSGSPATYGAENLLVFSATVTSGQGEAVPNGDTVTVTQGAATLCTATLASGTGSCSPASATAVAASSTAYAVTATFNSAGTDPEFSTTATAATGVTVNKDTTTTTVSETSTTVTYGAESASTFTAKVTATHGESVPNGEQVTITVGTTSCVATTAGGTGSGTCTIANTALPASATAYAVSATYGGDANLSGSTISATTGLAVAQDTATVSAFTVSGSPATYGAENLLVFSATVTSGQGEAVPNGDTVTVTQGATTLCTATLTSGTGSCSPASATAVAASSTAYAVTATFNSAGTDPDFPATATKSTVMTIDKGNQTITFTSNEAGGVMAGDTYTPTATANSGLAVVFTVTGNCTISAGVVTFANSGTCTVNADQGGDADYNAATASQTITVDKFQLVITSAVVTGAASSTPNLGVITVESENRKGAAHKPNTSLTVTLSSTSSAGMFGASQFGATQATITIPAGSSTATFWYGDGIAGTPTISAAATNYAAGSQPETITAPPAGLGIALGPGSAGNLSPDCTVVTTNYTCDITGTNYQGNLVFSAQFSDANGNPIVYSTTQSSTVNATSAGGGTQLTVAAGASNSPTFTLPLGYGINSGTLTFGPYTLVINITS